MPPPQFDRRKLLFKPLRARCNKVEAARDFVDPDAPPPALEAEAGRIVDEAVARLRQARENGRPRMLAFGAHAIKNGLGPVLIRLLERGWLTHLATNGAGIIHDWEFAFQGASSEDVRSGVARGEFGMWEETGRLINLALLVGAHDGLGYGESVGRLIEEETLTVPAADELRERCRAALERDPASAASAADLLAAVERFELAPGPLRVEHPHKSVSVQAAAWRLGAPFTGHPMFGCDIIYAHPLNCGAALGRAAERDFLTFAQSVAGIEGGVYLSVGSAVMSPMVFEKSMSMARNLARGAGRDFAGPFILVADLQPSRWDWSQGEPPEDNPDYYLRYCKSFARMGGELRYLCLDNRVLLPALLHRLEA